MKTRKFTYLGGLLLLGAITTGSAWLASSEIELRSERPETREVALPRDDWWSSRFPAAARHEAVAEVLAADAPLIHPEPRL
ncbi:MAG: hypothetical protein KY475_19540 [Planctomycetes bacterium]|nr:hypothetical protein [Planctomycetota bacterium]